MSLPEPDPAALAASRKLEQRICAQIEAAGGWIDFSRYMDLALYEPGLGYYSGGSAKFGAGGDFVTAPEISPLFGRALAQQVAQVLRLVGGDVIEAGAGSGALACDLLLALEALDCLPRHYFILEVSDDLRERQRTLLRERAGALAERVVWLERLPERIEGCVVANELLDALPVHVLRWSTDGVYERGVTCADGRLGWHDGEQAQGVLREQAGALPVASGTISEIGMQAQAWVSTVGQALQRGALLLVDYGFGEREFYHPQREHGTLMCHYRQHAHDDPFFLPGLQDITAHVDFTAIAVAGRQAGLRLGGFVTQAQFLLNCGILALLEAQDPQCISSYLPHAAAVQKLLSPAEMGELFKVMALVRGVDESLLGFVLGDQRRRL